jgi:GNAT superfamily N-acetyltransferase
VVWPCGGGIRRYGLRRSELAAGLLQVLDRVMIRGITREDIPQAASLLAELGYPASGEEIARRVEAVLSNPDDAILVCAEAGALLGLISVHSFEMIHRPGRMGRITALIVASAARGRGTGSALLQAAEAHLRSKGCIQFEVTSAEQRSDAHGFYAAHGYREKRLRFFKDAPSL